MKKLFPYGLDAPGVVRNMAVVSLLLWLVYGLSFVDSMPLRINGMEWPAAFMTFGTLAMIWSSFRKVPEREKLLGKLVWRGDEQVLDIGCGRGLLAIGAAHRLPEGQVTGIDIWQTSDLSGNSPQAAQDNALKEGVSDRVSFRTADMRELPFAGASMDIVISALAIHNIAKADQRKRALLEIIRVLKPGGKILIEDIRHPAEYREIFQQNGCIVTVQKPFIHRVFRIISFGNLNPAIILGWKE
ncbi:methyltransferase domain-containing protein [Gluconobacter wancherniae]|uniref:class I SAM-dependent methyltransferase n=1 Tax=Gluconobacter wancherniae TaxID=1307955 RepID=UPI001B8D8BB9|nr:class I SAM-dependent methyltransferase [Gluconobacter wancherniae]MBS1062647.1 methyltransferase domain-containing protein [Gluconobacter wancherniae]